MRGVLTYDAEAPNPGDNTFFEVIDFPPKKSQATGWYEKGNLLPASLDRLKAGLAWLLKKKPMLGHHGWEIIQSGSAQKMLSDAEAILIWVHRPEELDRIGDYR